MSDLIFGVICGLSGAAVVVLVAMGTLYLDMIHAPLFDESYLD